MLKELLVGGEGGEDCMVVSMVGCGEGPRSPWLVFGGRNTRKEERQASMSMSFLCITAFRFPSLDISFSEMSKLKSKSILARQSHKINILTNGYPLQCWV